jgi:hypothetical protein
MGVDSIREMDDELWKNLSPVLYPRRHFRTTSIVAKQSILSSDSSLGDAFAFSGLSRDPLASLAVAAVGDGLVLHIMLGIALDELPQLLLTLLHLLLLP